MVRQVPSVGETPLDRRRADAFMGIIQDSKGSPATASPYVVVAHVPLGALVQESGEESTLAGELEHGGLIDTDTVRRIACDATIAVGG